MTAPLTDEQIGKMLAIAETMTEPELYRPSTIASLCTELLERRAKAVGIADELCRYGDADYWTNARTFDIAERLRGNR